MPLDADVLSSAFGDAGTPTIFWGDFEFLDDFMGYLFG